MARSEVVTDLVGGKIMPRHPDDIGNPYGAWPINDPNLSGEHVATVRAVWRETSVGKSDLKLLAESPSGLLFETYASIVNTYRSKA